MNRFLGLQAQIGGQLPIRFSDEVAACLLSRNTNTTSALDALAQASGGGASEAAPAPCGNPFAGVSREPPRYVRGGASSCGGAPAAKRPATAGGTASVAFAKVVALESTIISHGMPYPENVACAKQLEAIVRAEGAVPATIAILSGVIHVGLNADQLETLGKLGHECAKVSRRDLPSVLTQKKTGATTVSGTILIARMVGIDIMATGGIGGVHRGAEETMDVSADLLEMGRTRVLVVCAGVKSILDIGKTLEVLETQGVPVIGYQTDEFPAFFTRRSGFKAPLSLHSPSQGAYFLMQLRRLLYPGGGVLAVPIPAEHEAKGVEAAIAQALRECKQKVTQGRDVTPFLLQRVNELTKGDSLRANIALVKNNTKVAAQIAANYHKLLESRAA